MVADVAEEGKPLGKACSPVSGHWQLRVCQGIKLKSNRSWASELFFKMIPYLK